MHVHTTIMSTKTGLPIKNQPWDQCMYMHGSPWLTPLLLLITMLIFGCKKEDPAPEPTPTPAPPSVVHRLELVHHIDGEPLHFDSLIYVNEAGHQYSVTRLQYYVSEVVLHGTGGTTDHNIPGPYYIDGRGGNSFDLATIPSGTYGGASLLLGLSPEQNITNALPNTMENVQMAWPEPMGGGYHFLKFEGHFINAGNSTGFAMHIGKNEHLPHCDAPGAFAISGAAAKLILKFDLNEVFRSPHTYDLAAGNYSMGSPALMALLRDNCADAFTIHVEP